ncbi:MAG: hypothetical protein NHB15_03705 [Methanosarcina barkeri]|nr:hypothetical protein [Methanosarcina sp. ERenArc_MAG2]
MGSLAGSINEDVRTRDMMAPAQYLAGYYRLGLCAFHGKPARRPLRPSAWDLQCNPPPLYGDDTIIQKINNSKNQ